MSAILQARGCALPFVREPFVEEYEKARVRRLFVGLSDASRKRVLSRVTLADVGITGVMMLLDWERSIS